MKFFSTNNPALRVTARDAVLEGLAPDGGLYMPVSIRRLSPGSLSGLGQASLVSIGTEIASPFLDEEMSREELHAVIASALDFPAPLVRITNDISVLELFHGPTFAFKDFGARFLARLIARFGTELKRRVNILVATSGDTGAAVAHGFFGVENVRVILLYPSGKVSPVQEQQFTTLGRNITALEIEGTFDDCQRLVKEAFLDDSLRRKHVLASANSINIGRLIPQIFYYFHAAVQLGEGATFVVPSGNFGNLTAGLIAKRMGLPAVGFIAATNANDVVPRYLSGSEFDPRRSVHTVSNAMDVGNPSNFARILSLYGGSREAIVHDIVSTVVSDAETIETISRVYRDTGYILDPHTAVGFFAAERTRRSEHYIVLGTAHPGKFPEIVERALGASPPIPKALTDAIHRPKRARLCRAELRSIEAALEE